MVQIMQTHKVGGGGGQFRGGWAQYGCITFHTLLFGSVTTQSI
jgi:hypothetical protein